jgi:tetratricopeptide (TPR) repeat protein
MRNSNKIWTDDQLPKVIEQCSITIQSDPDFIEAYLDLSLALKLQGRLDESAEVIQSALLRHSEIGQLHTRLSDLQCMLGDFYQATIHARQGIDLDPLDYEPHYILGCALCYLGKFEESAGYLQKAVHMEPDNVNARTMLGIVLCRIRQWRESIEHLTYAQDRDPNNRNTQEWLKFAHTQIKRGK